MTLTYISCLMQIAAIVLLWWMHMPHPPVEDRVAVAELNHVLCPVNGTEQGVFWVWWRWQTVDGREGYYVADWRREVDVPRPTNGVQEWLDKGRVRRRVVSRVFRETWTQYDREEFDRKRLPEYRRRKLR